jgi:transposase
LRRFPLCACPGKLESAFFALETLSSQMTAIPYDPRTPAFPAIPAIHLLSSLCDDSISQYHSIVNTLLFCTFKTISGIATRYDKRGEYFLGAVYLAAIVVWIN